MNTEIEKKINEIHAVVVKGVPSSEKLRAAAQNVVDHVFGTKRHSDWEDLKNAIAQLDEVIRRESIT